MKTTIYYNPAPKAEGARNHIVIDKPFSELLRDAPAGFFKLTVGGSTWITPLSRVRNVVEQADDSFTEAEYIRIALVREIHNCTLTDLKILRDMARENGFDV